MEPIPKDRSVSYHRAVKKAKQIKGFYVHLFLYVLVNVGWFIVMAFFDLLHAYSLYGFWGMGYGHVSMAVFWGLGLLLHGVLVFGGNWPFSKKWEQRKVQELMDKDRQLWE
ncbi:hypothetical protein C1T31_12720 [Hanstruepera neustonica]|uniref:2TM domain-containing protein n=1 Tax=Hanstruepera neustonica TaxID=1445657 RepID=A0A2K1DVY2_9FLAO|nr:2TM domain-containing protein [Hanstruepera neustonica]PNQ72184.1 hypothetical protein C1T31_12720 [Hanstruepera neustonica]